MTCRGFRALPQGAFRDKTDNGLQIAFWLFPRVRVWSLTCLPSDLSTGARGQAVEDSGEV